MGSAYILAAIASSIFAGATSILAKCGIRKTDSDVATAIRTIVVLIFAWVMVFVVGSQSTIRSISAKSLIFLGLSGLATGASWLCYFKALSMGDVNKVAPIDKSSTIISVLLAILLFNETRNLPIKLVCTALIACGIFLMIEKKPNEGVNADTTHKYSWMVYAILSAVFAAATSLLAKVGIEDVESNLATALRTIVVLIMAWVLVAVKGKMPKVKEIEKRELLFICLSGIATGASWLCYYYAIQNGVVSVVVPIDKLSIVVTILFSRIVFKEKLSRKAFIGLILMVVGTVSMAVWG